MARDSMQLDEVISEIEHSVRLGVPTWTSPEAITNALHMLKEYKQLKAENTRVSGWIPCSERMPERDGFYLAYYTFSDGRHACDMVYFNVGAPISSSITHWKPLPEPPEAEDKT